MQAVTLAGALKNMDEFAGYVWSAYGVAAVMMAFMLVTTLKYRARARCAHERHKLP